ncbi:ABC transporter permease [Actinotalea sp. BY-33]|uniref:Transport permease protein n=1 Tax=Actinotalea soli TaxID=2819234 RepID=A0A939LQV9_9CELL|nr:ABC transporter permease [Actinotalea soli]MBO1750960.1 ABC transporter permease [Actinotalea soli]
MSDTAVARTAELAQQPMRIAGPRPGFARGTLSSIRDIYHQRELMGFLVRRELKAKYKDSALGFVWTLIRPLAMLLIYYLALGKFLQAERSIPDFAVFIYTGLTAWTLFSEIINSGTSSIVGNSGLIKKVYLPREIFPLSVVGSAVFNFLIQLTILVGATLLVQRFPTGPRWGYFFLALAVLLVFGTALALLLSAVNVYLRDMQYLVDVALLIFFWASPIVYSWRLVTNGLGDAGLGGGWVEEAYLANPMTLVILGFQQTFWVAGDGEPVPDHLATRLGVALVVGLVLLWLCQRTFARLQSNFAQEL